jgi:SAM-dependent methyltransferase
MSVAPSNEAQLQAWDGDEGAYWAAHADAFDRSALPFHRRLLAAAAITEHDRVLDVGCGTGQTTVLAARAARDVHVLGVDLSSPMLAQARRRAAADGVDSVSFLQADAQIHPFDAESFDVVISNTGATFFGELVAGFSNLARALGPDGRLVLLTWQSRPDNEWIRELTGALAAGRELPGPPPGTPSPFALADPPTVHAVLGAAGFADVDLEAGHDPMWLGHDADDAQRFVLGLLGWMLRDLDDAGTTRAVDALRTSTAAHETADGVMYDSAFWIVRARRP